MAARRQAHRDEALAKRLFQTFEHEFELVDVQGFHFYVQDGTVTVFGTVQHELDRDMLTALIRQVPGVKGVIARLQTVEARFNAPTTSPGDA